MQSFAPSFPGLQRVTEERIQRLICLALCAVVPLVLVSILINGFSTITFAIVLAVYLLATDPVLPRVRCSSRLRHRRSAAFG